MTLGSDTNQKFERHGLGIVIENPAGSYKDFETKDDPVWAGYPLAGVTYPVPYGYIEGFASEDDHDLDVFVGSGEKHGYFVMIRRDIPLETKFFIDCTDREIQGILEVFKPVVHEYKVFGNAEELMETLNKFKR